MSSTTKQPAKRKTSPAKKAAPKAKKSASAKGKRWKLRLYIAGQTPKSLTAMANLKKLCETHLAGNYAIEIVDLLKTPERAKKDEILAIPTLIRTVPEPLKRVIGDLSKTDKALITLEIITDASIAASV